MTKKLLKKKTICNDRGEGGLNMYIVRRRKRTMVIEIRTFSFTVRPLRWYVKISICTKLGILL